MMTEIGGMLMEDPTLEQGSTLSISDRVEMAKSLFGILPADITLEDAQKERLEQLAGKLE